MMRTLVPVDCEATQPFALDSFPALLGRSMDAAIRLDDGWVSRRHCQIDQIEGTLLVRDLQSKHGTFVNGERVTESVLLPGDKLSIGKSTLLVSETDSDSQAVPSLAIVDNDGSDAGGSQIIGQRVRWRFLPALVRHGEAD